MKSVALLALCWLLAVPAIAATGPDEPLDPDKAFRLALVSDSSGLSLNYAIVDGYYLYRNRFKVQVVTPGLVLKPPAPPPGEAKDDPYFGVTEIYRRGVAIPVAIDGTPRPGRYAIEVTAQGCADSGFCYAPFTQKRIVTIPAAASAKP